MADTQLVTTHSQNSMLPTLYLKSSPDFDIADLGVLLRPVFDLKLPVHRWQRFQSY